MTKVAAIAAVTAVSALGTTAAASAHTVLPPPLVGSFPAATSYTVAAGTSTTFQAQYSAVRPVGTVSVRTTGKYATVSPSSIRVRVFGPRFVTVTISVPAGTAPGSVSDTLVATASGKTVTYAFTVVVPVLTPNQAITADVAAVQVEINADLVTGALWPAGPAQVATQAQLATDVGPVESGALPFPTFTSNQQRIWWDSGISVLYRMSQTSYNNDTGVTITIADNAADLAYVIWSVVASGVGYYTY